MRQKKSHTRSVDRLLIYVYYFTTTVYLSKQLEHFCCLQELLDSELFPRSSISSVGRRSMAAAFSAESSKEDPTVELLTCGTNGCKWFLYLFSRIAPVLKEESVVLKLSPTFRAFFPTSRHGHSKAANALRKCGNL